MTGGRRSSSARQPARPRWRIDEVLDRTDLASLLDELAVPASYTVRGRRWHCPLPDHDDQHPSVTMHVDTRGHERWRCWSGDGTHRGDAIDLVMATQRIDRRDALDWLASRAGMVPDRELPPPVPRKPTPRPAVVPLDPAVVRYAQTCEQILAGLHGAVVRDWLAARGLGADVVRANHVGCDPGRQLLRRQRGLPYGAGVAATFPVLDTGGHVRYLQARYLDPGDGPKYDNPAAALGSNPRLAWTLPVGEPRPGLLVVCEGIPDALTAAQAGFQAVGVLGSQCPDVGVAARLATHADQDGLDLVAVVDADPEGRRWGQRLGELLLDDDKALTIIEPPADGLDLNAWALDDPTWADQIGIDQPGADVAVDPEQVSPGLQLGE